MAVSYYLIFHRCTFNPELEWATKYHWNAAGGDDAVAEAIAQAEANLTVVGVSFNRWEWYNAAGHKAAEGNIAGVNGIHNGDMMPIKYAVLLRLNVGTILGRPSQRYIHGYPESFSTNGIPTAGLLTSRNDYSIALLSIPPGGDYVDSDSNVVEGHGFRTFTKRKRLRRLPI